MDTIDYDTIARLNDEIVYLTQSIERSERFHAAIAPTACASQRTEMLAYVAGQRDALNRLYAELSNAWDVSYAALGARP